MSPTIDPDDDFASWYENDGDPDSDCERLYQWHRLLWGRPVRGIPPLTLDVVREGAYGIELHTTNGTSFRLGSDAMIPTWSTSGWTRWLAPDLAADIALDTGDFWRRSSQIGAYILFPRNREGQSGATLNQLRGTTHQIADRFDLTLECIRRHYLDPSAYNPLGDRLAVDADFFALFRDFDTYVRFFLLDDLVTEDRTGVVSFMTGQPVDAFTVPAYATTVTEYARYREASLAFVHARNDRIRALGL